MEIKIHYDEIMEAIQIYLKDTHGIKVDVESMTDFPWIETHEHSFAYTVDEDGKKVRDPSKDSCKENQFQFGCGDSISFYI